MDAGNRLNEVNSLDRVAPSPAPHFRPAHFSYAQSLQEPSLLDYWRLLLKRKKVVLAALALSMLAAAVVTMRTTRLYEAVTKIAVYRDNPETLGFHDTAVGPESTEDWDYTVSLSTQQQILESDTLAAQVIRDLKLGENPGFAGSAATPPANSAIPIEPASNPSRDAVLAGIFHSGLKVTQVPNTRLLEIRYRHPNATLAAQISNALASDYVQYNLKTKYEATMQASEWISKQLVDLQITVESSQARLAEYQKEHGILGVDEKQNIITTKLDDLNKQLTAAQGERIQKEANYQLAQTGRADQTPAVADNQLMHNLRSQQNDLENQLAQATTQFGPSYPKVVELNNRLKQIDTSIDAEVRRTTGRLQSEYLAAVQREKMLHTALDIQKQEANKLNESAVQYNLLKHEADSNRQLYDGLLQKMKEASVAAGLKSSNVRVVDSASVPLEPAQPNVPRNLALGLVLGLTGGISLAFVFELLDNSVRTPEQVQVVCSLPAIGVVPFGLAGAHAHEARDVKPLPNGNGSLLLTATQLANVSGPVAHLRPRSEMAESYRALRTSILLSRIGAPPKVLLITSALPQEGKTTTAVNSAVVLAQKGARVLLLDADMRRPGVHALMGLSNERGLSTLLSGDAEPSTAFLPSFQMGNLAVLPAGPTPRQPAELLGSEKMRRCLEAWRQQFDHIVIDTPPALTVTDAVMLSVDADAVVLVVRSGQTPKDALRRARDLLLQVNAKILGVLVNGVDLESPELSYYYYGSRYGGRYYNNDLAT